MQIKTDTMDGVVQVTLTGEATIYYASELKQALLSAVANGPEVCVDLEHVSEIDTAGIQQLYLAKREANALKKPLRLLNHSSAVCEALDLFGMAGYFGDPVVITETNQKRCDTDQQKQGGAR